MADILKKEMLLERWDYALFDNSCSEFRPNKKQENLERLRLIEKEFYTKLMIDGSFITLVDVLNRLGIRFKPNQVLAGWHFNNLDIRRSLFEIMELKNGTILIHFLFCEKYLLDDIYKGRLPERGRNVLSGEAKKFWEDDLKDTTDIYERLFKNKGVDNGHNEV